MFLPPLRTSNNVNFYISGEVKIDESAAIAPGVILQAGANGRIIIGSGVCIGMGSILQVCDGVLEIETGANLGAGVLMVGQGKIGANACVGAATTILNSSIAAGQVVAPGSIFGDTSRKVSELSQLSESPTKSEDFSKVPPGIPPGIPPEITKEIPPGIHPELSGKIPQKIPQEIPQEIPHKIPLTTNYTVSPSPWDEVFFRDDKEDKNGKQVVQEASQEAIAEPLEEPLEEPFQQSTLEKEEKKENTTQIETPKVEKSQEVESKEAEAGQLSTESSVNFGTQIYGRGNIERLLTTLFPHRQSMNKTDDEPNGRS
jgi:carbon dioxide concentrating mechanism protein CcmN